MDPSWKPLFDAYEFGLDDLYASKVAIYPAKRHVFRVFQMPVQDIQVVLLGQDPYPGYMQAHGLSFSVPKGVVIPPFASQYLSRDSN